MGLSSPFGFKVFRALSLVPVLLLLFHPWPACPQRSEKQKGKAGLLKSLQPSQSETLAKGSLRKGKPRVSLVIKKKQKGLSRNWRCLPCRFPPQPPQPPPPWVDHPQLVTRMVRFQEGGDTTKEWYWQDVAWWAEALVRAGVLFGGLKRHLSSPEKVYC